MSWRDGGGTLLGNSSSKGKNAVDASKIAVEQLSHAVADVNLDSTQEDGGWEVISRKNRNTAGSSAAKPWGSQSPNPRPWGHNDPTPKPVMRNNGGSGRPHGNAWQTQPADSRRQVGRGNGKPQSSRAYGNGYGTPQAVIPPPLEHGWNWQSRAGSTSLKDSENGLREDNDAEVHEEDGEEEADEDDDELDDSDDELLSDDYDSDTSQKSHETRKKCKWFKKFFESLDSLSIEEINEPARQWHCPACHGGPGAIDWYRGLQPLVTHARTKGAIRVKLHRELAELLEEELIRRGTSVIPPGEMFGKWKGLKEEEKDHQIVWPPMVVIMNTRLDKDENEKWLGMGNQELLDYFSGYAAVKARHSYGPQGHRGISVLIFESSARGYFEAERLHKHFADQGTDRNAWERNRKIYYHSGGKRQLFGFMAVQEDLDIFNQHSHGKSKLKFEIRSYNEMVTKQLHQMSEDNTQLHYYKNKIVKEQKHSRAVEESLEIVSEKLRKTMEENRIVRQRTQMHNQQNQEEMDSQEQFFKEQIKHIHETRDEKEEGFEKLQWEKREKVKQFSVNPANTMEYKRRVEEVEKFIQLQDKEMGDFVTERDNLVRLHEERIAAMKRRHWEEEVALEKEFDDELTQLMEKYTS